MQLIQKVYAYRAICEMMREDWEFDFIYPLVCRMGELARDYEFFSLEERKLVAKYGKKEADGTVSVDSEGGFTFADAEAAAAYGEAHRRLEELEREDSPALRLTMPRRIRGEWLRALLPLCDFPEKKEGDDDGQIA